MPFPGIFEVSKTIATLGIQDGDITNYSGTYNMIHDVFSQGGLGSVSSCFHPQRFWPEDQNPKGSTYNYGTYTYAPK